MNRLVSLVIIVGLLSCKSNSIAQEKQDSKTIKDKIENKETQAPIKLGGPTGMKTTPLANSSISQIAPGTIQLTGVVKEFYKSTTICNRPFKAAIKIKVENIIKSGSGLVNLLSKDQEITLGFMSGVYTKDLDALQAKMQAGRNLSIQVTEGLCPDFGNNTVFEISRFEVKKVN